jgi:acyl carrier protein
MSTIERELIELIVTRLELEVAPEEIDPNAPLFGEGLGLDSIDALEISILVSEQFGVKLDTETENVNQIFSSVASLVRYIEERRS